MRKPAAPSPDLIYFVRPQEDPTLTHQHFQPKQGKTRRARNNIDKCWAMPNVLVEFMCHLPKTAMALPIKPLRWVTRQANPHTVPYPTVYAALPGSIYYSSGTPQRGGY